MMTDGRNSSTRAEVAAGMEEDHLRRELARRTRQVAVLARAAQALAGALDVYTAANAGLSHVLDITEMDAGEILLWDPARAALIRIAHAGAAPEAFAERQVFRRGEGFPGKTVESEGVISLSSGGGDHPLRPSLVAAGFQTFFSVPLRTEERVIGVMLLAGYAAKHLDAETEELLRGLGGQIGIALDRARAYEQERALRRRLEALNAASLAIAAELSLPNLLQRITDIARELTGARYAALGVVGEDGRLVEFITSGISAEERARIGPPPEGCGLLGLILRGSQPVRVANIAEHPAAFGFPPGHPVMTSFLGVPIALRGRNLGNLYLTDKNGGDPFTDEDEQLLVQLAAHAAVAIENARLYGQTSESLQQTVAELRAANAQLAHLSSLAIGAQEEERRRLARELHDGTAQELATLLVRLRVLERTEEPQELRLRLGEFRELIARALDDVRRMALDLRPTMLDDLGLVPALEAHTRDLARRWGITVRLEAQGLDRRLPGKTELVAYRIVQEALANSFKHSQATEAAVTLALQGRELRITVRDNGRGFDVARTLASRERGLGLFGMQERAALVGGYLELASAPGAGTRVTALLPVREPAEGGETP